MTSYFSACDVRCQFKSKNFSSFFDVHLCPPSLKTVPPPRRRLPVKRNVSHVDESITALRVQISFKFAGHSCGDIQDIGLNV